MDNLSTVSLSDFVRNAEIMWLKGMESFTPVMRNSGIVKEVNIAQNSGDTREFSSAQLEQYASRKGEREQMQYAKTQQGYSKIGTLYRVAIAEPITYEMRTRNKYPEVVAALTNLLPTVAARLELDLQLRISFATATSYTDRDGVTIDTTVGDTLALASTAHTVRASSTTYRNRLANNPQVSTGALESMEKMRVENHINQFAQKMPVVDDIIWTTDDPNTVNTVRQILKATAAVDAPNAGVPNVYQAKYKHVVLPRVAVDAFGNVDSTKAKYWGLCSSRESAFYLGMHEEPHVMPPQANGNTDDALTQDWYFRAAGGWMIVIPDANWFSLSTGDGTP